MSNNKLSKKEALLQKRAKIGNVSALACVAGIVGIVFSPSIPVTVAITVIAGGAGLLGSKKLKQINEEVNSL